MLAYLFSAGSSDDREGSEAQIPRGTVDSAEREHICSPEDTEIITRIRASDPAGLEHLFTIYGKRLLTFATQQLKSYDAAEDIVQDIFLSIWRNRENWIVRTSIASYLFQAARHRIHDRIQQRRGENPQALAGVFEDSELHSVDESSVPDVELEHSELQAAINRAIASLSPKTREVFQLSRDHGLSYREIAELLGISIKTVEMHVGRALAALRLALKPWKG